MNRLPALKHFVVEVILKSFAVFDLQLLLLYLPFRQGTGATFALRGGVIRVVPFLLLLDVQVGRDPIRRLHSCRQDIDVRRKSKQYKSSKELLRY